MEKSTIHQIIACIICILLCEAVGFAGSIFTTPAISTWYVALAKPAFNPPNYVFAPVWSTLFVMMGIALFLVWRTAGLTSATLFPLSMFGVQLGLNLLWSILFFGLRSPSAAFIDILLLWLAILATIILFLRLSKIAGMLLVPYLLWVSFAAVLNYAIWRLNV